MVSIPSVWGMWLVLNKYWMLSNSARKVWTWDCCFWVSQDLDPAGMHLGTVSSQHSLKRGALRGAVTPSEFSRKNAPRQHQDCGVTICVYESIQPWGGASSCSLTLGYTDCLGFLSLLSWLLIDPVPRFYEAAMEGSISLVRIFDPDAHTCLLLTSLTQLEEHCVWSGLSGRIYQRQGRGLSDVCVFIDWHKKQQRWSVPACFRTSAGWSPISPQTGKRVKH